MKLRYFLVVGILGMFLTTFPLSADGDEDDHTYQWHMPRDMRSLHLSDEQHRAIRQAMKQNLQALRKLRKQEKALNRQLKVLFNAAQFERKRYEKLLEEFQRRKITIEADLLAAIHRILTPRQRQRFSLQLDEWEID